MPRLTHSRSAASLLVPLLMAALSCNAQSIDGAAVKKAGPAALTQAYPPGRWRLAPMEDLSHVMLWVSHILIRHDAVAPGVVSFELGDWIPAGPAPARTRKEAFALAQKIAEQLQKRPQDFAGAAQKFSEDIKTKERGGSLGGICAAELYVRHAAVLDALAALKPGEVSRVVETVYGFHIFQLRSSPPEETVSGARIVIAYDEAPWLKAFLARRAVPARSRAQALVLAESLYGRARRGESFDALVETYSDHEEALHHGDFGAWSTRQCTPLPREIELLQQLAVGEIAPPLDSPFGVEIIRRTANRPRQQYAMTSIQQPFAGPLADKGLASAESVLARMQQLAGQIGSDPARFAQLRREYCCADVQQWLEGQGSAAAEQALASLKPGQVSAGVVRLGGAYAIVKRLAPQTQPAPTMTFKLPAPAKPDIEYFARQAMLNGQLPAVGKRAREVLGLKGTLAERFTSLHDAAGAADEAETEEGRVRGLADFLGKVEALLGAERYRQYLQILDDQIEKFLLLPRHR